MTTAIDLVEKFQTGLVGLIGFTGVIITLIVNARIDDEGFAKPEIMSATPLRERC